MSNPTICNNTPKSYNDLQDRYIELKVKNKTLRKQLYNSIYIDDYAIREISHLKQLLKINNIEY